jgi:hypothetical protein
MKYLLLLSLVMSLPVFAIEDEGKDVRNIQFESLLIQGQVQRPDIAIVTGSGENDLDGLLRLREDFSDLMAMDQGEVIP